MPVPSGLSSSLIQPGQEPPLQAGPTQGDGVVLDARVGLAHSAPADLQILSLEFWQLHPAFERAGATRAASAWLPACSPPHPGYLRSPGKKPRTPVRFLKPNGVVGSPARSTGGSLFLAVAAASVGSRICDLDLSGSLPFSIPLDSLPPTRSVRLHDPLPTRLLPGSFRYQSRKIAAPWRARTRSVTKSPPRRVPDGNGTGGAIGAHQVGRNVKNDQMCSQSVRKGSKSR